MRSVFPQGSAWALAMVFVLVALAGCMESNEVTEPLVQETLVVGRDLFTYGEAHHFGPAPGDRKAINASFEVEAGTALLGVSFQGTFIWSNSTAVLTVKDPDGREALRLQAMEGAQDDVGTVSAIFEYHRSLEPQMTGSWRVLAEGYGNISTLDFRVHAIMADEHPSPKEFHVPSRDVDLVLRVEARGWGEAPQVGLVGPDGSVTPIDLPGPRSETRHEWTAAKGDHELRFDTTGWGGRLIVQVLPV